MDWVWLITTIVTVIICLVLVMGLVGIGNRVQDHMYMRLHHQDQGRNFPS